MADGQPHDYELLSTEEVYRGRIISLRKDTVAMPGGGESVREVVHHPGAVGVVAIDDDDRVVMLRQYRHPVGEHLWELPAGLRDVDAEPPVETARRELAEEVQLAADRPDGFVVEHEELDMTVERVPLADAVQWVFDGTVRNSLAIIGLLAAAQVRATSPRLRPLDAS